jgi:hypothetical protein
MRQELVRNQRQMGVWGSQVRAIGTTIRYALAGAIVYGVATAVSSLGEFENKLGEIDSLAARLGADGKLIGLGDQLDAVGDRALQVSNKFGIAATDIQSFMTRFYSSFDIPQSRVAMNIMSDWIEQMGRLSLITEGADPNVMGGGVAGFIQPRTRGRPGRIVPETERMIDIIAETLRLTPTIRGEDIARDIGRLGAAQTAMRMTPEQVFAVYGTAGLLGGSPAVIGRGITQLLASEILKPQTEAQREAFGQAGLPTDPGQLRRMGGWRVLMQMMRAVQTGPISFRNQQALAAEDLTDEEAIRAAGVRGINATLASNLFGRQESFRQFLNLLAVGGPKAMQDFIDNLDDATKAHRGEQRAQLVLDRRYMQQAREASRNLTLQIVRGFAGPLRVYSQVIGRLSEEAIRHQTTTTAAVGAVGGGILTARVTRALARRGMFGRGTLARRMAGGRAVDLMELPVTAAMVAEAAPSLIEGAVGTGSRAQPVWVVLHPWSWLQPGAPSFEGGGGGGTPIIPIGGPGRVRRAFQWAARNRGLVGGVAALAGLPLAARQVDDWLLSREEGGREIPEGNFPRLHSLARQRGFGMQHERTLGQQRIIEAFTRRYIGAQTAELRLARLANALDERASRSQGAASGGGPFQIAGQAVVALEIGLTPDAAKVVTVKGEKKGVPVRLWTVPRPQHRGRPGTSMRGQR